MSRKTYTVTTIATLAVFLTSLLAPVVLASTPVVDDVITDDYALIHGVLDTDTYALYPYEKDMSLVIGFSKYGEIINDPYNVGLEYWTVDPFAPPAGGDVGTIPKRMWVQGWLINISYVHSTLGPRNVWACALFSDTRTYGGTWIRVDFYGDYSATYGYEDPRDPGYIIGNYAAGPENYGGRKTNGTAVTEPIEVLYNGPRLFVAKLVTTIYDHPIYESDSTESDIPLVRVTFTILFNKVKKQVIIFKDVKSLLTEKEGIKMKIQFSDRGEVDLGTEDVGYHSFFHFYTEGTSGPEDGVIQGQPTVYNLDWTMCQTETPEEDGLSAAGPFPQPTDATFDVAQAINPDVEPNGVVWWAAFWPSLSDWTIDGWPIWWKSMMAADPHYIDAAGYTDPDQPKEPKIPFYIGEWDFYLWAKEYYDPDDPSTYPIQFRGVTVYGVADLHDGDDEHMGSGHDNALDSEVKYQLDEVFNPFDLWSAVRKQTNRYVKYVLGAGSTITLSPPAIPPGEAGWDDYCSFAERVIDLTTGTLLVRDVDYELSDDGSTIRLYTGIGHDIKVLWSSKSLVEKLDEITIEEGVDTYQLSHWPINKVVAVINVTGSPADLLKYGEDYMWWPNGTIKFLNGTDRTYYFRPGETYKVIYDLYLGRYEWIVVGKGSKAVDSAGAAMVSEAFDSLKNIPVRLSAFDRYDATWAPYAPYLMSRFATTAGDPRDDWYYFNLGAGYENDYRSALKDHWCTVDNPKLPISSSNIISVAGPSANLVTEYFNEFMPALFRARFTGVPGYVGASDIMALTCWTKNTYKSGHAVIGVYKDINGTVGFIVWGWSGQDTYEACKWLWEGGIEQLQDAPRGLTAIVLEFDYSTHPTTVSVVECLGTISETLWTHDSEFKGGIHDP